MTKENNKLSEEIEILIAQRLMGEISKDENLKLEIFFQENPEIKKAYFEKEGVKRLLVNAASSLEELQLPLEKRNQLFKKASSKNSGRAILYTYAVAASVFFSFMIGLYFYANKANPSHNKESVYALDNELRAKSTEKENELSAVESGTDRKVLKEESSDEELPKKEKGQERAFGGAGGRGIEKLEDSLQGLDHDRHQEKELLENEGAIKNLSKKEDSSKPGSSKSEAPQEKAMEYAKSIPEPILNNAPITATPKMPEEKISEVVAEKKSRDQASAKKATTAEGKQKGAEDFKSKSGSKADSEELKDGSVAGESLVGSKEKNATGNAIEKLTDTAIASDKIVKENEYEVEVLFNNQKITKKLISSIELKNDKNTDKKSIKQYIDLHELADANNLQNKDLIRKSPSSLVTISDKLLLKNNAAESKVTEKSDKNTEVLRSANTMHGTLEENSLIKELALIHTCYKAFLSRNDLSKDLKKNMLEEIKKSLSSISIFKEDADIKSWLANIEKELNPQ